MSNENESTSIKIAELRKITIKLFDHLDELGIEEIDLEADFYWSLSKEDLYDPYRDPKTLEFTLGQLYDNWNDLKRLLASEEKPIAYEFIDLAALLHYIGITIFR